jgi:hypothetical protein
VQTADPHITRLVRPLSLSKPPSPRVATTHASRATTAHTSGVADIAAARASTVAAAAKTLIPSSSMVLL